MKKLLILLNFIVFFINASAQLAPVGTKWVYEYTEFDLNYSRFEKIEATVLKDTLIDSTTYSLIYCKGNYSNTFYTKENYKIFYYNKGEKLLFFDFDKKVGDSLYIDYTIPNGTSYTLIKKFPIYIKKIEYIKTALNDSLKLFICSYINMNGYVISFNVLEKILTNYAWGNLALKTRPLNYDLIGGPYFEGGIIFKCYSEPNGFNFKVVDDCNKVGLKNIEPTFLEIYPNPVSDFLYIKNVKLPIENISIYNLLGVLIYSKIHNESSIDFQNFPSGVYLIEVKSNNEFYRQKFIKE